MVKLNLSGHPNSALEAQGFTFPGALHVDLAEPNLPQKVAEFLAPIEGLDGSEPVIVVLPGLAPLAAIVLTVIHGLTGQFPVVQPLIRGEDGTFYPGPSLDLQGVRNQIARQKRENLVNL